MSIRKLIPQLTNFFLILFILFTVLPVKLNYSSITIVILVILSLVNLLILKNNSFKRLKYSIFSISIPIVIYALGLINSTNIDYGLGFVSKNASFLAFPLIFFSLSKYINKDLLFKFYLLGLFVTNLYLLYLFVYYFNFGLRFYKIVTIDVYHSTYLGMYSLFAYWICFIFYNKNNSKVYLFLAIFFFLSAVVTSARIIFLLSILSAGVSLMSTTKSDGKRFAALVLIALFSTTALINIPSYKQKFNQFLELDTLSFDKNNYRSISSRFGKLEASLNVLKDNIWIGTGTGDAKDKLVEEYKKMNFTMGYKRKYNPHNQYLDNLIRNGIIGGIISLFAIYLLPFYISIRNKDKLLLAFTIIVAGVSLTESILDTHKGITFYVFFVTLMLSSIIQDKLTFSRCK
ncbi:O-antigen ligase family protein [Psychroflexus salinarum]|uniref:O-antigen ligase family protein n=1 Tax=Psychroflexus salinarum TaxID=546024 RepID=A0ABW3GS50_9FLAO